MDHLPVNVSGPTQPYVNFSNLYTCTPIANADSYQWRVAQLFATNFFDGAENGLGSFITTTSAGYDVITNRPNPPTGGFLFHLAQPEPPADQLLQINRAWLVATNTQLRFRSRLAKAATAQVAKVQISLDDGVAWNDLYSQSGTGGSGENSFTLRTLSLSNYSGREVLLRFNYHREGFGSFEPGTDRDTGWFLDDIVITNVQQTANPITVASASASLNFKPTLTGVQALMARPLLFGGFPIEWGTALQVVPTTNAPPLIVLGPISVTGGNVEVNFTLQSGAASTFKLLQANAPIGAWTTNLNAMLTTNSPGSSYRFTAAIAGVAEYYRVQTP
jgi:hypothetical protein